MAVTLNHSPMAAPRDESQLVEAARAGDDRAFEGLYARYRDRIFAFILGRVGDHGRAEDIAQEVFISALRRLHASEQDIAFKPWIYEIAKNACIDEFRRGTRSREVPLDADGEPVTDRAGTTAMSPTPAAAVESKQRMSDLRGAFGGLSENQHRLLVMREFEGLSYDEIGARLDMTRPMVESGLFRARRKLAEEYEELATGRRCRQVQLDIGAGRLACAATLGLRERRRFARHLAHCQICRHMALQAGVDQALVKPRSVAEKIAALLPVGLWRWVSGGGGAAGAGPGTGATGEQAANSLLGLGPAAVAAAGLMLAGGGGGLVHHLLSDGRPAGPPSAKTLTAAAPGTATAAVPIGLAARIPAHARGAGGVPRLATFASRRSGTRRPAHGGPRRGGAGSGGGPAAGGGASSGSASPASGHPASSTAGATSAAGSGVRSVTGAVGSATRGVTGAVGQTAGTASQQLASTAGSTVSTAGSTVSTAGGTVSRVGSTVSGIGGAVKQAGSTVSSSSSPVGQTVGNVAQGAGSAVQQVGGAVQQAGNTVQQAGSATGAASASPGAAGAVKPVVQAAGQTAQGILGK